MHDRVSIAPLPLCLLLAATSFGQIGAKPTGWKFGFESEILTWIQGGYHGSVWLGRDGLRLRAVVAQATFPQGLTPNGFRDLTSQFYEMECDLFLGDRADKFRGTWIALGGGLTRQSIRSDDGHEGRLLLADIHSGFGYTTALPRGFTLNPWVGIDLHLNTPDQVAVGSQIWKPRWFDPVLGCKAGWSI
jgi:hypothetical protein